MSAASTPDEAAPFRAAARNAPDLGELADRWLATQQQLEARFAAALGGRLRKQLAAVTLMELDAVTQLAPGGEMPDEIGKSLSLDPGVARALVGRLLRRGYFRRERPGARILIGPRGEVLRDTIRDAQAELLSGLIARVPPADRHRLMDLTMSILRAAQALRDAREPGSG